MRKEQNCGEISGDYRLANEEAGPIESDALQQNVAYKERRTGSTNIA